ncbi:hypothetical protein LOZ51_005060 [Ophidiomyces ophidiicola]|nr:hypothetical protein LOZ55_003542 [Ophidiomyces ophidiicola]KAI1989815.1 hypothetical protein LOZ51_005060 [Ophidiomyces ophidiicola]
MASKTDVLDGLTPLSGRLVALPTVQELRPSFEQADALVAEIDIKSANTVQKPRKTKPFVICARLLDSTFPRDPSLSLTHLRRFAKPEHLPEHLKPASEGDSSTSTSTSTGSTIYVLISPPLPDRSELLALLTPYLPPNNNNNNPAPTPILRTTTIPLQPPLSPTQARQWSHDHWPTTYNPAAQPASHAPPPKILQRAHTSLARHAGRFLALAWHAARDAQTSSCGRRVGAVVVDPALVADNDNDDPLAAVVAVAGDARYRDGPRPTVPRAPDEDGGGGGGEPPLKYDPDTEGQPSSHAVMRAIDLVSQKRQCGAAPPPPSSLLSLSALEARFFGVANLSAPAGGGYLCTGLDVYVTHEPCVCCAMGVLLSRFRAIVVGRRDGRRAGAALDAEKGYGLHWRRELNWRAMAFEFVEDGVEDDGGGDDGFGFHA